MSGDAARHSETARHNNAPTDAMVAAAPQCSQAPYTWLAFPPERPVGAASGRELTGRPTRWPASGSESSVHIPGSVDAVGWTRAGPVGLK
jgi:hypothetical protein